MPALLQRTENRWLVRKDVGACVAIEKASFTDPWAEEDFIVWLRKVNHISYVATLPGSDDPIGHLLYKLPVKAFQPGSPPQAIHIVRLAIYPEYRRLGIGVALVAKPQQKIGTPLHRYNRLTLRVRESNLPGQLFWRSVGFKAVKVERGYYRASSDNTKVEDAYFMQWKPEECDGK